MELFKIAFIEAPCIKDHILWTNKGNWNKIRQYIAPFVEHLATYFSFLFFFFSPFFFGLFVSYLLQLFTIYSLLLTLCPREAQDPKLNLSLAATYKMYKRSVSLAHPA